MQQLIVALTLLVASCGSGGTPPLTYAQLIGHGPHDLETHALELPRLGWVGPVDDVAAGRYNIPNEEVLDALRSASRIVLWPGDVAVAGRWEVVPPAGPSAGREGYTPSLQFVREGEPASGWEALVVDRTRLPVAFQDPTYDRTLVVRFSPRSRPFVVRVAAMRIPEPDPESGSGVSPPGYPPLVAGNDSLAIEFSEPIASVATAHSFIQIESQQRSVGCEPYLSSNPDERPTDVPLRAVIYQCPPFSEGQSLQVRVDGRLASPDGVSVATAYSRPEASEVVLDVTLRGDDTQRTADPLVLEAAAGVPPRDAAAP